MRKQQDHSQHEILPNCPAAAAAVGHQRARARARQYCSRRFSMLASTALMLGVWTVAPAWTATNYAAHSFSIVNTNAATRPILHHQNNQHYHRNSRCAFLVRRFAEWNNGDGFQSKQTGSDPNTWKSADEEEEFQGDQQEDWQDLLAKREDGSYWSDFEPSSDDQDDDQGDDDVKVSSENDAPAPPTEEEVADAWLDTLASLSAEEVEFNLKEADRADKVRQMQEWGFEAQTIANTLDVAMDDELEKDEVQGMKTYRQESYLDDDDIDLTTVESHSRVDKDPDTGEPIRQQMVYVDEHTCIGCTNCAMIAQSTFFMHEEHGRARVFDQWGDDDETIQVAIETCPVDCIHYVPYDELVKLEVERRDQNINFKARLVSQGEYGGLGLSHAVGGPNAFTAPQTISGNLGTRCNNCPSRGCQNCPMYGVGKNPEFERKEKERLARMEKKRILEQRERENKSANL